MTPTMLLPTATTTVTTPETPRTPEAMAADFIAALAAALPATKVAPAAKAAPTAPTVPTAPTAAATAPSPDIPLLQAAQATANPQQILQAAPTLPTLQNAAAPKLGAKKTLDLPTAQPNVEVESDQAGTRALSSVVTPDVIAALIAAMVPPSASPKPSPPTSLPQAGDGSMVQATPATPALRTTPTTSATPASLITPGPQSGSPILQALAIVSEKSPGHSSSFEALSAIVADAVAPKSQAAPETVAVATASSFALPQMSAPADTPRIAEATPQQMVQIAIPVHVEHPQWGQAVGEQLVMAVHQGKHSAELRLDPPNLGPVSVQIELNGNQAKVSFVAPVNATCDALAQSLPDLRNAFSAQGMTLAQANIAQQQTQQQTGQGGGAPSQGDARACEPAGEVLPIRIVAPRGLVDEYA